jgi:hypothetical protein
MRLTGFALQVMARTLGGKGGARRTCKATAEMKDVIVVTGANCFCQSKTDPFDHRRENHLVAGAVDGVVGDPGPVSVAQRYQKRISGPLMGSLARGRSARLVLTQIPIWGKTASG